MMDASILLPPTGTPLTGIDFVKRLPCGDVERTRRVSDENIYSRSQGLRIKWVGLVAFCQTFWFHAETP